MGKTRALVLVLGELASPELGTEDSGTQSLTSRSAGPSLYGIAVCCVYSVCAHICALRDVKTYEDSKCLDNKM